MGGSSRSSATNSTSSGSDDDAVPVVSCAFDTCQIPHCLGRLSNHHQVTASVHGLHGVTKVTHQTQRCTKRKCRAIHGHNYVIVPGSVNCPEGEATCYDIVPYEGGGLNGSSGDMHDRIMGDGAQDNASQDNEDVDQDALTTKVKTEPVDDAE